MTVLGTSDAPLDLFGGLVTDMAPCDLPPGVSPDCADVAFIAGAVKTRPGLLSIYAPLAGNPTINYLKTYIQPNLAQTLLALDSAGTLWGEMSPGSLSPVAAGLAPNSRAKSATLFGREYIAISDGKFGVDIPRQYDGTNFDRVSQVGPGAGPAFVGDAAAEPTLAVAAAPSGAVRANAVATITTTSAHGYVEGQTVTIAGVTDGSFDGVFVIAAVPSLSSFTYLQSGAASASGAGTATLTPQVSAGVHQVAVFFKTRQGYLTQPSPPVAWNAAGGRRVTIGGIPLASSDQNVVARVVAFTASGGDSFFYTTGLANTPSMVIGDNSTTSVTLDFSDTVLLAGSPADPLFDLVELGECAGVIGYSSRLFWWGERNKLNNFANLSFDGGWSGNTPLGWATDLTSGLGGLRDASPIAGACYDIIGDGVTAIRGMITQPAATDPDGVPRISPNTGYSVRARVRPYAALAQGTLYIELYSASTGLQTAGLQVTAAEVNAQSGFAEYIGALTAPLTAIPADLLLRIYAGGTPTAAGGFTIDNVEIFPTALPYNSSVVRASFPEDPESYDGVTGLLAVAANNGQAVRAAFVLRGLLYFVKENSIHATQDDGVNEPAHWALNEVSRTVGTTSVHGADVGEDWAVIADRSGLYIFDGGEPIKLSQEIQPLWDQINWAAGETLWVRVDTRAKRILVGVPIAPATQPNRVLALDYRGLSSASEIATLSSPHASAYTGRFMSAGRCRKWAPWNMAANCATLAERPDGTARLFLGNGAAGGAGNGKIYELSDAQLSDDGVAIAGYYTTYFVPCADEEQQFQVQSHRKLFVYLTCYVQGAGNLNLSVFADNEAFATVLAPLPLSSPAPKDLELPLNVRAERAAFQVGTNQPGAWFQLSRLVPSLKPDPWSPVREGN
jgi:hypothetical protein